MKTITKIVYAAVVALALACFSPSTDAAGLNPPPDGGYAGGNTAEGQNALFSLTTGGFNTAVGFLSLFANTTGSFNTAVGAGALDLNSGDNNTATGAAALLLNTTGANNTANGVDALAFNNTGSQNTANGAFALFSNTTGFQNTANGAFALRSNTAGAQNTAAGVSALFNNTTGSRNTADGTSALYSNTTADGNTAAGWQALFSNTTGNSNTANGYQALYSNTTGGANTALGWNALASNATSPLNTAIGWNALANCTGSGNIALGAFAGYDTTNSRNIDIGNSGVGGESNTIRIGEQEDHIATYIAGIFGATIPDGAPVYVATDGKLGTVISSGRFKDEIKPMDRASEAIMALKPVTFHYKADVKGARQFGLVAEEVANVCPDLIVRDKNGEIYTVRYDAVNAMLLNEFLKEHRAFLKQQRKIEVQDATIAQLKSTVAKQEATTAQEQRQIEALTAGLQKVSAQLEAGKLAPQMVATNP